MGFIVALVARLARRRAPSLASALAGAPDWAPAHGITDDEP